MKNHFYLLFILFSVFTAVSLSCNPKCDSCTNGTCRKGVCDCDPFYVGVDCSETIAENWAGNYSVKEYRINYTNPPAVKDTVDYQIEIAAQSYPDTLYITGVFGYSNVTLKTNISCVVGICNEEINLEKMPFGTSPFDITEIIPLKFMTRNPGGSISMNYKLYDSDTTTLAFECSSVVTKIN